MRSAWLEDSGVVVGGRVGGLAKACQTVARRMPWPAT
jgi:hypothetical protein